MNSKLADMAERIKEAFGDLTVNTATVIAVLSNRQCDMLAYYKPTHDIPDNGRYPSHGRVVLLFMNGKDETKKQFPFRAVFVDEASDHGNIRYASQSVIYECGEEENIALNLKEYLVDGLVFPEITFDVVY